jgi:hypothetical protein
MAQGNPFSIVPPTAWRAHEEVDSLGRPTGGIFVGREREMAALRAGLEAALAGHGRLILLVGEAGIGKTWTVHELGSQARQRGAEVLLGRCDEGDGAPSFWPWVQVVRAYVAPRASEILQAEMGAGAAVIAQVIAAVRERLPDLPIPPALDAAPARFRFFDSMTTFLKNAAHRRPLVLFFDDLHGADKPSLLLLQFLARELSDSPLLVVGTYRDSALHRQHPLTYTLGELVREPGHQRLFLQGLSQSEVASFIEFTAGVPPAEAVVASLYRQTEGNPFFLTEMVRLLVTEGGPAVFRAPFMASRLVLPQGVRDTIGRRLQTLSTACHHLLTLASVIGREFDLETLGRISDVACDQLLPALDTAVAARLITDSPHMVGRYSFTHALFREILYADLPMAQRVRLHRQIGEIIEERYGLPAALPPWPPVGPHPATGAGHILAELAYHFFETARGGNEGEKAIGYAVQAGEQATAMLAYEEAAGHFTRALQLVERLTPTDATRRCELLLALGRAQTQAGDVPQARDTLLRLADTARRASAPELLARASLGFEKVGVEVGLVDQPLVALLEEALRALGEGDSALRARVLARLAQELVFSTAAARRVALSRQAVSMARQVGDLTALAAAVGDRERAMRGRIERIADLLQLGMLPVVDAEIDTYLHLAEELRQPRYLWYGQVVRTTRVLLAGRFEDGEHLAQQAFAIGQRVQPQTAAHFFGVQLLWLRREQGRLQELEAPLQGFVVQYPAIPAWRSALASLYSDLGRDAEARGEFERLAARDFTDLPRINSWLLGVTLLAEVCAFLADTRRAATLYDLLMPYAEHNVVVGHVVACHGSVSRLLGLLATTLARWDRATWHFEAAIAMHLRLGARPFVARTQCEYASMLLTRNQPGDAEKARELLDVALNTARALGMQGLMEKALTWQHRLLPGLAPTPLVEKAQEGMSPGAAAAGSSSAMRRATQQEDHLFRQEGDYWTLAYQGATCRLKAIKGLHYIALLLRAPGQPFHALDLVTILGAGQRGTADREAVHDLTATRPSDVGALLDAPAKAAYRRRLHELRDELTEAQRFHDPARATKAQTEIDFLTHELAAALGLGGRDRKASSVAERARSTVTKSIKAALKKIRASHPALGHHLATHIRTGTFCQYLPDPTQPLRWTL